MSEIEHTESEDVLEYLRKDEAFNTAHDGERGLRYVRRAVLNSLVASDQMKRKVNLCGEDTTESIPVPDNVAKNAK